jgi:hypothetical protein
LTPNREAFHVKTNEAIIIIYGEIKISALLFIALINFDGLKFEVIQGRRA